MRSEDCYFVAAVLEADCGIDDKAFGTADTKVGMEEDDVAGSASHYHCNIAVA